MYISENDSKTWYRDSENARSSLTLQSIVAAHTVKQNTTVIFRMPNMGYNQNEHMNTDV